MNDICPFCSHKEAGVNPYLVTVRMTDHIVKNHLSEMINVVTSKRMDVITKAFWECVEE